MGLILAQLGSACMYLLTAHATTMEHLYLTALPSFFQHAMLCCSAAVAALSTSDLRAAALGRLGLSYGIGMAAGSPLGGYLATHFGLEAAFLSAAFVSLLFAVLDVGFLPELRAGSHADVKADAQAADKKKGFDAAAIYRVACKPGVRDLLVVSFSSGIATSAFRAMFALAAVEELGLSSQDLGFLMSFTAMVGLVTNVFLVAWVVRWVGEHRTLVVSLVAQAVSFIAMSRVHGNSAAVTAVSVPQAIASTFFYTLSSSLMTKCVEGNEQGTVVSLAHATRSGTQVIAPLLGSYVMKLYRFQGVSTMAAFVSLFGACFAVMALRENSVVEDDKRPVKRVAEEKTRLD
jgi:OCT family organic cation transporter-like MFS transporter 18